MYVDIKKVVFFTPIYPSGVLVLPPNNLLRSNLRSSDEIDIALSVVVLLGWEKNFEFENLVKKDGFYHIVTEKLTPLPFSGFLRRFFLVTVLEGGLLRGAVRYEGGSPRGGGRRPSGGGGREDSDWPPPVPPK